jgi:tripartite-type tricarboxylate transporter receptor subunit TctC
MAVLRSERVPSAPDVPGAKDLGLPTLNSSIWTVFMAPKGTSKAIVGRLNASLRTALEDPTVRERLKVLGVEPPEASRMSPEGTRAFVKAEIDRWLPIIRQAGISLD